MFTEAVYVCVDELATEVLLKIPRGRQKAFFDTVCHQVLRAETFFDGEPRGRIRRIGSVSKAQIKEILRVFSNRRLPSDKDLTVDCLLSGPSSLEGVAKGLDSLPVRLLRCAVLDALRGAMPEGAVSSFIVGAATRVEERLAGDPESQGRARRAFFRAMAEDFIRKGGHVSETLVARVRLGSKEAQVPLPL